MSQKENNEQLESFWSHAYALRNHFLLGGFLFILIAIGIFFLGSDLIVRVLLDPLKGEKLLFLSPLDPLFFKVKASAYLALVITLPVWLAQALHFISPAFSAKKRLALLICILWIIILGALSLVVSYLYFLPVTLDALKNFLIPGTDLVITANNYLNFYILESTVVFLIFQIPILISTLTYLGIVNLDVLRRNRRITLLTIITILAIITPTTDIITLVIVSACAFIFWELGIIISHIISKRKT